jgi:uncharacterized protein DUF6295
MCTYATHQCAVTGSGKSAVGWFPMTTATVYVDHPVHAQAGHTLNIDFAAPDRGPSARVAVELHTDSALRLLATIAEALLASPSDITGLSEAERRRLGRLVTVDSTAEDLRPDLSSDGPRELDDGRRHGG